MFPGGREGVEDILNTILKASFPYIRARIFIRKMIISLTYLQNIGVSSAGSPPSCQTAPVPAGRENSRAEMEMKSSRLTVIGSPTQECPSLTHESPNGFNK